MVQECKIQVGKKNILTQVNTSMSGGTRYFYVQQFALSEIDSTNVN